MVEPKVYTVHILWPDERSESRSLKYRGPAVAFQIRCIKRGAKATISKL